MRVQRGLVELIAFQPQARQRRGPGAGSVASAAKAQNRPLALRHVPGQPATRVQLRRQVHHAVRGHHGARREGWITSCGRQARFHVRRGRIRRSHIIRLLIDVADALVAVRCRKGQHHHVAIELVLRLLQLGRQCAVAKERWAPLRSWEEIIEVFRPGDIDRACHNVLHRLLRLHPRPAAPGPARPGIQSHLQSQSFGLSDRVLEQRAPLGTHKLHRPARDAHIHLHHDHPADASPLQCLEVRGDALAGQVAIHHEPINPGPRGLRRIAKALFQFRTPPGGMAEPSQHEGQQEQVGKRAPVAGTAEERLAVHSGLHFCRSHKSCGDTE